MMKLNYIYVTIAIITVILVAVLAWWYSKKESFTPLKALQDEFMADLKALAIETLGGSVMPPICHLFCKKPVYMKLPGASEHVGKTCNDCVAAATRYHDTVAASVQVKKKMGAKMVAEMVQMINKGYQTMTYKDFVSNMFRRMVSQEEGSG